MLRKETVLLFYVCCPWLIPNGMKTVVYVFFLPSFIAYGKSIPQHFIVNIFLGHNIEMYVIIGHHA
jgi:hypothetical protein